MLYVSLLTAIDFSRYRIANDIKTVRTLLKCSLLELQRHHRARCLVWSCLSSVYFVYFAINSFILNYSIGPMLDRHKVNINGIPTVQGDSFDAEDEMENRSSSDRERACTTALCNIGCKTVPITQFLIFNCTSGLGECGRVKKT